MVRFSKHNWSFAHLTYGEAFGLPVSFSRRGYNGEWIMEEKFVSGRTSGYLKLSQIPLEHFKEDSVKKLR
jgi:hypothetical protein